MSQPKIEIYVCDICGLCQKAKEFFRSRQLPFTTHEIFWDKVADTFVDSDLTRDGMLDLWTAAERALHAAGVSQVDRVDLCTRCNPDLFFSYRRSGAPHGAQGVIGAVAG